MSIASDIEAFMLTLINEVRAEHGLGTLTLEMNLNQSADDHSAWMIQTDTFSPVSYTHLTLPTDVSGTWRTGENLAVQTIRGAEGLYDDVRDLHQSLMNSPGHRANILNASYTHIGIGIDTGPMSFGTNNEYASILVTQNFGTTQGTVDEQLLGGSGADNIRSSFGEDYITAGAGDDVVQAGAGRDTIDAGDGNDSVSAGLGADLIRGGAGHDTLQGDAGNDTIFGNFGGDMIRGGDGNDVLRGGYGHDNIQGNIGFDTIFGEFGDDVIQGGNGNDLIRGGVGHDNLQGNLGNDAIFGDFGNDLSLIHI